MVNVRLLAVSLAACGLTACASSNVYTGADTGVHHFNQVGRRAPAKEPMPTLRPAPVQLAAATPSAPPSANVQAPGSPSRPPTQFASAAPDAPIAPAERSAPAEGRSLDEARRRVIALLSSEGFDPEADAQGVVISASRMATAKADGGEAVCGVRALSRPRMYAANVDVHLSPVAKGVQVDVDARFEEMDQNLVSGELTKHACASRGVLEAQVRRAATGG